MGIVGAHVCEAWHSSEKAGIAKYSVCIVVENNETTKIDCNPVSPLTPLWQCSVFPSPVRFSPVL